MSGSTAGTEPLPYGCFSPMGSANRHPSAFFCIPFPFAPLFESFASWRYRSLPIRTLTIDDCHSPSSQLFAWMLRPAGVAHQFRVAGLAGHGAGAGEFVGEVFGAVGVGVDQEGDVPR